MTLGHLARARGARHWAAAYFEQAIKKAGDPTEPLAEIVTEKRAIGDLTGAEETVARIFAETPDSFRGHMANGYLRRAAGDRSGAHAAFLRATEVASDRPQAHVELSVEHRERGSLQAALGALDAALSLDPRHEEALLKKAACLTDLDDADAALSIYAQLRRDRPASVWAYLAESQLLVQRGDVGQGLEILQAASQTCSASSQVELRRAEILRRIGLLDLAREVLQGVRARFDQELTPWCHVASLLIELGQFDEADAMLASPPQAVGSDQARIIKTRAQRNKALWNLETTIDDLSAAIEIDPRDSHAIYERAKLKVITFDIAGARDDLVDHARLRTAEARREGRSANISQSHVGQLYDEFSMDRELVHQLTELRKLAPENQISPLIDLVNAYPDSTAPAIGLMIALRRAGRLDPRVQSQGSESPIPRLITQYWNDPRPPADIERLMQSWPVAEPDFQIDRFDDAKALAYLTANCNASVARAFSTTREPAQRADIFRLARLSVDGGFFVDADDRPRGGLTAHVPAGAALFAHQEDLGSIGNNVMGVVAGHPAITMALADAVDARLRGDRDIIWLSTGPGLLTRAVARWLASEPALLEQRIASTALLTLADMRRAVAMHCHAAYKSTPRAWLNKAFPKRKRR